MQKEQVIKGLLLFNEKVSQFESVNLNVDFDEGLRALSFFYPNRTIDPLKIISAHYDSKEVPENFRKIFNSIRQRYIAEVDKLTNIRFPSYKVSKISRGELLKITLTARLSGPNELESKEELEDRSLYDEILASREGMRIDAELQFIGLMVLIILIRVRKLNLEVLDVLDTEET